VDFRKSKERRKTIMGLWKRGNKWWAYFYVAGVRYQVPTGTSNERQAERIFQKLKEEANLNRHGLIKNDPEMTFGALAARFIATGGPRKHHLDRLRILLPYFSDVPITEITKAMATEFRMRRKTDAAVSDATINRDLSVVKRLLYWAVDERLLNANPLTRMRMERERKTTRPVLGLDDEQLLLGAAPQHLRRLAIAALDTGMRRGELFHQRWEDLDFGRRVLFVTRSKTPEGEAREIPLTNRLFNLLWDSREDEGFVFTYQGLRLGTIKRTWKTTLRRSGIKPFRFHDLRHTFNTRLMEAGVVQDIRKALMGHSSGGSVNSIYTHVELPAKREAIAKLEQWVHDRSEMQLKGGN
jgi:integrase